MSCGCGRRRTDESMITPIDSTNAGDWGPCMWYTLHCLAEKLGRTKAKPIIEDQAFIITWLIEFLPAILPCKVCQAHTTEYLRMNPFRIWSCSSGNEVRNNVRIWLMNFHNTVRESNGQPIEIQYPEACEQLYADCTINPNFINDMSRYVTYAIQQGWVRMDMWKRWIVQFNKLKLII
jgi:hypothetical protein